MPTVVQLFKPSTTEVVTVLRALLVLAEEGDISGLALSLRDANGHEEAIFCGYYKEPRNAVLAANRMSWIMTQATFSANS